MTRHESSGSAPAEGENLTAELRRRAEARRAVGVRSFDDLRVDIGQEDRTIESPELLSLREVVAQQVDLLQPPPARSLLGRVRAKIEATVVRADGTVPVLIRREVNQLSVALLQYVAALSRDVVSLRSEVSRLSEQLDQQRGGTIATDYLPQHPQSEAD